MDKNGQNFAVRHASLMPFSYYIVPPLLFILICQNKDLKKGQICEYAPVDPPGQFDEDPTTWDLTWKFCPIVLFLSTHRRSIWEDVNVWMNDHLLITLSISNEYSDWNTGTGMTGFIGTNRTQGDQLEEMVTSESHCQSRLSNPIDKEWHWDGRWSAEAAACNIALLTPYWRLHYPEWVVPGYSQTQCPGTKCNIAGQMSPTPTVSKRKPQHDLTTNKQYAIPISHAKNTQLQCSNTGCLFSLGLPLKFQSAEKLI